MSAEYGRMLTSKGLTLVSPAKWELTEYQESAMLIVQNKLAATYERRDEANRRRTSVALRRGRDPPTDRSCV